MVGSDVVLSALVERLAPLGVEDVRPLQGGASSLTYAGTLSDGGRQVVVKVAPAGVEPVRNRDVLRQARVLRALEPTPVPVPEVLFEDVGEPPEVPPLFVMEFVDGTSLEPLFDRDGEDDESVLAERMRDAARTMAALHALSPSAVGLEDEPVVGVDEEIERWSKALETVDPALAPGWEAVATALHATAPSALGPAVVHGDLRLGNMLAVGPRIAAVIDWEIWSIGDPRVDTGWFLVNADPATYRRATRYADSLPSPADLAVGRELDWFQALACFKSTATWSLIVKHNRRRATPDTAIEEMVGVLPHLLGRAQEFL
jgi:aminoglycoside phosphotransferase (APT) family kinase protein